MSLPSEPMTRSYPIGRSLSTSQPRVRVSEWIPEPTFQEIATWPLEFEGSDTRKV
jgi:hypothetical protein